MEQCEVCGKEYNERFDGRMNGWEHITDCFAVLLEVLAPRCAICGGAVTGPGLDEDQSIYCCGHCASRVCEQNRALS